MRSPFGTNRAMHALTLGLLLAALPIAVRAQTIAFDDFSSGKGLTFNGAAKTSDKLLRITPSEEMQKGSAFFTEKVPLKNGFEATFKFQITDAKDGGSGVTPGADGFAFVIQNQGADALGSGGSGLGYAISDTGEGDEAGIKNSLAIEFDTFSLSAFGGEDDYHDPNGNHISLHSRGPEPNSPDEDYSLGKVSEGLPNFKDGKEHTVKIAYTPGTLKIWVDNMEKPVLTAALKLESLSGKGFKDASVLDADGKAWVGFTAGTGGLTETHDILSWKLTPQKAAAK